MTLKQLVLKETGAKSIADLKKKLKSSAVYKYGGKYSKIDCKSFEVFYTDNKNCFCEYGINLRCVGFVSQYGLDKRSITKAGIERGCLKHHINEQMWKIKINESIVNNN